MTREVRNALNEAYERDKKHILVSFLRGYYNSDLFYCEDGGKTSDETFFPLEERASGVLEALEELLPLESNLNDESNEMPLEYAVGNADLYMTEYLIKHGANPNYWNDRMEDLEEKKLYGFPFNNWYLEEIDYLVVNCDFVDGHDERVADILFKMMEALIIAGNLGSFSGISTGYDEEKMELSILGRKRIIK